MKLLDSDALAQGLQLFEHGGHWFLNGPGPIKFWWWSPMLLPCIVGIYQPLAATILRSGSNDLDRVPETVGIAVAPIGEPSDVNVQGDALALVALPQKQVDFINWDS